MTGSIIRIDRRAMVFGAAAIGVGGIVSRFAMPEQAHAAPGGALAPTQTMAGGANNYIPGAPLVKNLGTGFVVSGIVRRASDGAPMPNLRVQIWAATDRGGEREPSNRGSVITGPDGRYRLETSPIVPNFGQPHVHIAYDDPGFATLFLRPVLGSRHDTSITADFVLAPA